MTTEREHDPAEVVVYWRGGCFFCNRLLRALRKAGVRVDRARHLGR